MGRNVSVIALVAILVCLSMVSVLATEAQMYFSSDKNGQYRVSNIQEGDEIWIVVIDNDQNTDCDIRDKMSPDLKIMDPKTGAYIVWNRVPDFDPSDIGADDDYLEETGADTGVFTSVRAFQVGTRYSFASGEEALHTHVVDVPVDGHMDDFQWGHYLYVDLPSGDEYADNRSGAGDGGIGTDPEWNLGIMPHDAFDHAVGPDSDGIVDGDEYLIGRFENMDTLIGMYQDPNDATDVAVGMMKIIDTEATISWGQEIYKDANGTATITVVDPDENLNCNEVEVVPVFIIVNPGSWNPVGDPNSPTNFCMLKRTGGVYGVDPDVAANGAPVSDEPIRWYNIYNSDANAVDPIGNANRDGLYYIEYPTEGDDNVAAFRTEQGGGITRVSFYAQETGVNTGVFQLNLNSILDDLDFVELFVRDVLVAYYLDPNDFDDFKLATAYIEEKQHSITSFTDENRADEELYWIGRDPVYVQVIDANANVDPCCPEQVVVHICDVHGEDDSEWLILDEISSNSPVFFTLAGTQLWPVWDALGVGLVDADGGFQLQLDNWRIEAFNEDDIYARYNDVIYVAGNTGLAELGDGQWADAGLDGFPPVIDRTRVGSDVSFDLMSIADTQVYDGASTSMWFLDRQGNRVSAYVNSDCVFIEVFDPDQDEDPYRRERIDAYWDGGQNVPFGPQALNEFECEFDPECEHVVNRLLGDTNIFNDSPATSLYGLCHLGPHVEPVGWAKLYVLNPRNGHWAAVDLLETGIATSDFVSVICIDLVNVYECVPSLRVLPGDTIVAFYQDPSNHSDSAMISIKVGIGGGDMPASQQSTTQFVDANGDEVVSYTEADEVFVKVIDLSHAGATLLADAVEIEGVEYDLLPLGFGGEFITEAIDLSLDAGDELTATYTDPTNSLDTSSDSIIVVSSLFDIESFIAGPNPFEVHVTFSYIGTGTASLITLTVYDLSGQLLQELSATNAKEIVWDGTKGARCSPLANGAYIYVITATDGTNTYSDRGKVFIYR